MRVLFSNCADNVALGGDVVQMEMTARALRSAGVEVGFDNTQEPDPSGFDLVHLFNLQHYSGVTTRLEFLRPYNVKTILSAIFWDQAELSWAAPGIDTIFQQMAHNPAQRDLHLAELAKRQLRVNDTGWHAYLPIGHPWSSAQRAIVESVDRVLVSGPAELRCLQHSLGTTQFKTSFVTNAAMAITARKMPPELASLDYVLFVGRWADPRKNIILLSDALRSTNLPLVVVGPHGNAEREALVRQWLPEGTLVYESMSPEALASYYFGARVFVMPSWYETPGLASLEAALMGEASLVVGNRASEMDYFGEDAYYCDPGNVGSIRAAIVAAWEEWAPHLKHRLHLQYRIATQHTWEVAASQTISAYREVLENV